MISISAVVVLPLLLASTLQAIYRQNPGQLLKAFFVQLPLAFMLGLGAIQMVMLALTATDALCSTVAGGDSSAVTTLLSTLSKGLVHAVGDPQLATFVLLMVGLLVATASFVLWLELLVRAAAVYVAVLFLPLALITLVWPSIAHWCRRLVETLAALILSKFVIVATLSLAAGAVASGSGFASVLAGGALMVLATFVPFAILRLIPMIEAGAVGHLEGARQRGTAAVTRVPRSAASFALKEGMESIGASRLAAQAGAVGTDGGGWSGGTGKGGPGGSSGDSLAKAQKAAATPGDGGLAAGTNGMAVGVPGSMEERMATLAAMGGRGKGPKPVLSSKAGAGGAGGGAGAGAAASVSASVSAGRASGAVDPDDPWPVPPNFLEWRGPPVEPGKMRFFLMRNEQGGVSMSSTGGRLPPPWMKNQPPSGEGS
jgi:hypothetical protein